MSVAKAILDVDELLALLRRSLPLAKPWQRQLASHLLAIDRASQVLRMTVAMDRDNDEILAATEQLCVACRSAGAAISVSRADNYTRAAVQMLIELSHVALGTIRG
jgi:hypothetical protein